MKKLSNKQNLRNDFITIYEYAKSLVDGDKVVSIEVNEFKRNRSLQQNKLLWSIYDHIVLFWVNTGFMPDNLDQHLKFINSNILHEWYKCKFNVKTTTKLNTAEFTQYVDAIQRDMIEQTEGEYEPIGTEEISAIAKA